eukprot:CAMPEP_0119204818 /NCGR_PEP_ID=MMETSP1316-20130426/38463_1 /TAXON_ID=41880 /ORGANISM="Pycnococcus provasolii, Strain RCC2336" /LENGTH=87 /DNA_ID=CAMNT_0007201153 /DNA_START=198 /DNA_END=458 /DNA_ORIENTATION=-
MAHISILPLICRANDTPRDASGCPHLVLTHGGLVDHENRNWFERGAHQVGLAGRRRSSSSHFFTTCVHERMGDEDRREIRDEDEAQK